MPTDNRPTNIRFPDHMADLETTGLDQGRNAIIQIAAVRFNLAEFTIDTSSMFDQCLAIPDNRYWEEQARNWWLKDKRETLMEILSRGRDPKEVLTEFGKWAGPDATFWSKPTHFDHSFLGSYCRDMGVAHPYFFRKANDMNSFLRGRYFPRPAPKWEYELPFTGPKHNALFDILHQINVLFVAMEDTKVSSVRYEKEDAEAGIVDAPF